MKRVVIVVTRPQASVINEALALLQAEVDGNARDYERPNGMLRLIERTRDVVHRALAH